MTDPPERQTREDAVYASLFAFLKRYGFFIAVVAPPVALSQVVKGGAFVLLVAAIWLGEAIVYAAVRRWGRGVPSGPAGEDPRVFAARIAGTIARSGALVVGSLVLGAVAQALGLPGMILVVLAVTAAIGVLALILSRMPS